MQHLVFEAAWEKTIDPNDKKQIQTVFEQANEPEKPVQQFVPFRQARNHRGDLLVTVIVQNFADTQLALENLPLTYYEAEQPVAAHTFSHAGLTLAPKFSMPWTFIFPRDTIIRKPYFKDGYVRKERS